MKGGGWAGGCRRVGALPPPPCLRAPASPSLLSRALAACGGQSSTAPTLALGIGEIRRPARAKAVRCHAAAQHVKRDADGARRRDARHVAALAGRGEARVVELWGRRRRRWRVVAASGREGGQAAARINAGGERVVGRNRRAARRADARRRAHLWRAARRPADERLKQRARDGHEHARRAGVAAGHRRQQHAAVAAHDVAARPVLCKDGERQPRPAVRARRAEGDGKRQVPHDAAVGGGALAGHLAEAAVDALLERARARAHAWGVAVAAARRRRSRRAQRQPAPLLSASLARRSRRSGRRGGPRRGTAEGRGGGGRRPLRGDARPSVGHEAR